MPLIFFLLLGSKRSSSSNGSPSPVPTQDPGLCISNTTPTSRSSPGTATDAASLPSGGVSDAAGAGSGSSLPSGGVTGAAGGHGEGRDIANAIIVEGDDPAVQDGDGDGDGDERSGKRQKRCTSGVWEHYTKKELVIEDNGKTCVQRCTSGVWEHYTIVCHSVCWTWTWMLLPCWLLLRLLGDMRCCCAGAAGLLLCWSCSGSAAACYLNFWELWDVAVSVCLCWHVSV